MIVRRSFPSLLVSLSFVVAFAMPVRAQDAAPSSDAAAAEAPAAPPKPSGSAGPAVTKPTPKRKASAAAKGYQLSRSAPVAGSANVHEKVLSECRIQTVLPEMIADRAPSITLVDKAGGSRLELKIVDIHAPSGGFFSGPKWITVEGRLFSGGTLKGNFLAKETSMASASACGMLHKVMTVLAGDIAAWLDNPQKNSRLGSAR